MQEWFPSRKFLSRCKPSAMTGISLVLSGRGSLLMWIGQEGSECSAAWSVVIWWLDTRDANEGHVTHHTTTLEDLHQREAAHTATKQG